MVSVKKQRLKYVICDFITTAVAFFLFNIYRYYGLNLEVAEVMSLSQFIFLPKLLVEDVVIPIILLGIYWLSGFYNNPVRKSRLQELVSTFATAIINSLLIYLALMVNDPIQLRSTSYELLIVLATLLFCFTYIGRYAITQSAINKFADNQWTIRTIIIGNSRIARQKSFELSKSSAKMGFDIIGYVNIPGEHNVEDDKAIYKLENLHQICREIKIDQFIIASEHRDDKVILDILNKLFPLNIPVKIWPGTLSFLTQGIKLQDIIAEPFVDLTSPGCSEVTKNVKRALDVFFSLIALILLSPLFIGLAIAVRLSSPGPIFFSQQRIGYRKKPFRILKFRSMFVDAEINGPQLSSVTDSRITPLGHILRKYRLDELPQFWNILKGDMSLVGPRPEREFYIRQIVEKAPWFTLLHQVRPGLTSWGMVKFGYASNVSQMVERARYDLIYLANMSIIVDCKILIYTIKTVISGKGL